MTLSVTSTTVIFSALVALTLSDGAYDPCVTATDCDPTYASCSPNLNPDSDIKYVCVCRGGLEGDGKMGNCNAGCDENAICQPSWDAPAESVVYSCHCKKNFKGDGKKGNCADIVCQLTLPTGTTGSTTIGSSKCESFSCASGYNGDAAQKCCTNGELSGTFPSCQKADCPVSKPNCVGGPSSIAAGSSATYSCDCGNWGSSTTLSCSNGVTSGSFPMCKSCPTGYSHGGGDNCYSRVSTVLIDNTGAKKICKEHNGHLPHFDTSQEYNSYLEWRKTNVPYDLSWLDYYNFNAHSHDNPGVWKSEDGSVPKFTNWVSSSTEPNDYGGNEKCVYESLTADMWNDNSCTYTGAGYAYFAVVCQTNVPSCQKDECPISKPNCVGGPSCIAAGSSGTYTCDCGTWGSSTTLSCNNGVTSGSLPSCKSCPVGYTPGGGDYCYSRVSTVLIDNTGAKRICKEHNGHLPHFDSSQQYNSYLEWRKTNVPYDLSWLDYYNFNAHSHANPGVWKSEDGSVPKFTHWVSSSVEPNDYGGNEKCVHESLTADQWNDVSCSYTGEGYAYFAVVCQTEA